MADITLKTFDKQEITPFDDAVIRNFLANGERGILNDIEITAKGTTTVHVERMIGLISGREFEIPTQDIAVPAAAGLYYLVVVMDLSNNKTPITLSWHGEYSMAGESDVNFTNGVATLTLCTVNMKQSGIDAPVISSNAQIKKPYEVARGEAKNEANLVYNQTRVMYDKTPLNNGEGDYFETFRWPDGTMIQTVVIYHRKRVMKTPTWGGWYAWEDPDTYKWPVPFINGPAVAYGLSMGSNRKNVGGSNTGGDYSFIPYLGLKYVNTRTTVPHYGILRPSPTGDNGASFEFSITATGRWK